MRCTLLMLVGLWLGLPAIVSAQDTALADVASVAEKVDRAMELSSVVELPGRRLTLVETLASVPDGPRRLEVIHAYWQLSAMIDEYQLRHNQVEALRTMHAQAGDEAMLATATAAAEAATDEADLAVVQAQHELARLMLMPPSNLLPLPADRPHAGTYQTHFTKIFAGRTLPEQGVRIDRTLPIRHRAIGRRAEAVVAARRAMAATDEAYRQGKVAFEAVLTARSQWGHQRRLLVGAVADYNHEIAEYVVSVVARATTPAGLVSMLIRTAQPMGEATMLGTASGLATWDEQRPTPAPPRDAIRQTAGVEPIAPPARAASSSTNSAPTSDGWQSAAPTSPVLAPRGDQPMPLVAPPTEAPKLLVVPEETAVPQPMPRATQKPPLAPPAKTDASGTIPRHYPALADAAPTHQAQQLAVALAADGQAPADAAEPIALADLLQTVAVRDRYALIDAYWQAQAAAVRHNVLTQQAQWLDQAATLAEAGSPTALRVETTRRATAADLLNAEGALLDARFHLTRLAGRPIETTWLAPSTVPRTKAFDVASDTPPESADTWPARRRAATVASLGRVLHRRAAAVIEADGARANATSQCRAGHVALDRLVECIGQQTDLTLALVRTLADYNRAVAEHVLATLPVDIDSQQLAAALTL